MTNLYAKRGASRSPARSRRKERGWSVKSNIAGFFRAIAPVDGITGTAVVAMLGIAVMMLLGGPPPSPMTTIVIAVAGFLLLGALGFIDYRTAMRQQPLAFRFGLLCVALLPLLQIVPLPPSWWHALPGQELRIRTLALAGLADTWQPLSVTPMFTAGACAIAIAFTALVIVLLALPARDIRRVALFIQGLIALNIVVGLVQVASGGQALRFHAIADHGALIGFYANKNHAALALAASMPIFAYLLGSRENAKGSRTWVALYAGVVLVALVTTNSRAGLGLGLVTAMALGSLYLRRIKPVYLVLILAAAVSVVALISASSAFELVFNRFGVVDQDLRWEFLRNSRPLIERYWIWGSGLGSFSTLYVVGEHLDWVRPTYVNELHNDYPQLLLEAGLPGVVALLALVMGLIWRGVRIWMEGKAQIRLPLICGTIILVLIAVHSGVDYPLRRPAVLPILALAIILAIRGDLVASTGLERRTHRS